MARKDARKSAQTKAGMPTRARVVLLSLVAAMTVVGGGLTWLDRGPVASPQGLSLPPLLATAGAGGIESIFSTRAPLDQNRWKAIVIHDSGSLAATPASLAAGARRRAVNRKLRRDRDGERLRRALGELAEEVRALRLRRSVTGVVRIAGMGIQLVVLLVAAVAFLNLAEPDVFIRWIAGAILLQLLTATVLLFDR